MKTQPASLVPVSIPSHVFASRWSNQVRLSALAALASVATASVSAKESASGDLVNERLAQQGTVAIKAAQPYVQVGTFLIQVATKLGRPSAKLPDGTWLYQRYKIENSAAEATLVVRFNEGGRVSSLSLVTPAVATAMMSAVQSPEKMFAADTRR